jgi:hypothetical protein
MKAQKKKLSPEKMRELINSFRGKFKAKPGDKPFAVEWAEYKREEKELGERKLQRHMVFGKK